MMDALNALKPGRAQIFRPTAMRVSSPPLFSGQNSGQNHFVAQKPDTFQRRNLENKTLSFQGTTKPAGALNPFQASADSSKAAHGKGVKFSGVSSAIHSGLHTAKNSLVSNLARQNQLGAVAMESQARPVNPFRTTENILFNPHTDHMMQVTKNPTIVQQAATRLYIPNLQAVRNLPLKMASGLTAVAAPLAAFTLLPLQPLAPMLTKLFSVMKVPTLIP